MSDRFEIIIVENGTRAVAELLAQEAPKTCEALWNAMETPWVMRGVHAMWSGCEIILGVPPESRNFDPERIPRENAYVAPPPGTIGWIYFPPNLLPGGPEGIWNIPLLYGPNRINTPMGEVPASIWAQIIEGLGDFAAECAKLQYEGAKTFRFDRLR
jgi:hypothetical protein